MPATEVWFVHMQVAVHAGGERGDPTDRGSFCLNFYRALKFLFHQLFQGIDITKGVLFYIKAKVDNQFDKFELANLCSMTVI